MLFFSVVISAQQYVAPYATIDIPGVPSMVTIAIDGVADASYGAAETTSIFKINGKSDADTPPCTTCTEDNIGDDNYELTFQTCWDADYLYLLCNIKDDVRHAIDTANISDTYEYWMFDNIEIFVDLDTTAIAGYTANITNQLRFSRGFDAPSGPGNADQSEFDYIEVEAAGSYALEVAIPWTAIGGADVDIMAVRDTSEVIGFEVSGADSDGDDPTVAARNDNGRQACWDWDGGGGKEDDAYADRQLFGFATLLDVVSSFINPTTAAFSVYPNPATATITISDVIGSAAVYSVTGAKVMEINNLNGNTTVNVSSLANGVYFITATETDGNVSVAKFIVNR